MIPIETGNGSKTGEIPQTGTGSILLYPKPRRGENKSPPAGEAEPRAAGRREEKNRKRAGSNEPALFCLVKGLRKNYFRLPRSSTVMVEALSAAATEMSLLTVTSPANMEATRAA